MTRPQRVSNAGNGHAPRVGRGRRLQYLYGASLVLYCGVVVLWILILYALSAGGSTNGQAALGNLVMVFVILLLLPLGAVIIARTLRANPSASRSVGTWILVAGLPGLIFGYSYSFAAPILPQKGMSVHIGQVAALVMLLSLILMSCGLVLVLVEEAIRAARRTRHRV